MINEPSPLDITPSATPPAEVETGAAPPHLSVIDPDNPPWAGSKLAGFMKAMMVWFSSVGFLLFVPLIFVLPYFLYKLMSGHPGPADLMADKTFIFLSILGVIPAHLLTLLVVWVVVSQWRRYPFWKTIGFSWPIKMSPGATIALSFGLAILLLSLGGLVTSWFGGEKTQLDQMIDSSYQARVATAFLAFATGPLVEELVYRGVVYPALARIVGVAGAVAIVSVMFAGVHVLQYKNNLAVIGVISILSVSLTVVRALTGRVLPSFLIHLVFNGLQSLYLLLQPFLEKSDKGTPSAAPAFDLLLRALHHLI